MNATARCFWILQATFLGTLVLLLTPAWRGDAWILAAAFGGAAELLLIPGTFLVVHKARAMGGRRSFKIALWIWSIIPAGYSLIFLFYALSVDWSAWYGPQFVLLMAPIVIPAASALWLPAILLSAHWIERWTRPAELHSLETINARA